MESAEMIVPPNSFASRSASPLLPDAVGPKIQIAGIRQRYLQKLVTVEPSVDTVTMNRNTVCPTKKLQSEADIDAYVAEIKKTLMKRLEGHDVLHII